MDNICPYELYDKKTTKMFNYFSTGLTIKSGINGYSSIDINELNQFI